jgi:hypothetical protein
MEITPRWIFIPKCLENVDRSCSKSSTIIMSFIKIGGIKAKFYTNSWIIVCPYIPYNNKGSTEYKSSALNPVE